MQPVVCRISATNMLEIYKRRCEILMLQVFITYGGAMKLILAMGHQSTATINRRMWPLSDVDIKGLTVSNII